MYIGKNKVKDESIDPETGDVNVTLDDKQKIRINKELYDKIKTEKEGEGTITDVVRDRLAREFLAQLAMYDLEFYLVDHVAQGMSTLAHNLREEAIAEKFGCQSAMNISISELLK